MGSSASWRLVRQGEHAPYEVHGDTIVGRSKKADLRLQEGFVSRRHARLWLESGRLMVEDLGSANGTFVNGERLKQSTRLFPGDCVTFDAYDYFVEAIAPRLLGDPNATGLEADEAGPVTAGEAQAEIDEFSADDFSATDVTGPAHFDQPPPAGHLPSVTQPMTAAASQPHLPPLDEPDFDLTSESATLPLAAERSRQVLSQPDPPRAPPSPPSEAALTWKPVVHAPEQPPASALAATVDMRSRESPAVQGTQAMTASPAQTAQGGGAALDPSAPALLATSGPLEGSLIHLEPGRILLGRGVECDIWIDHPTVSRRHLEIFLSGGHCRVRQMDGARGALLNGQAVDDAELKPGDILRVGTVDFVYDSLQRLTQTGGGLPPWGWMLVGFLGAGAILTGLFMYAL